MSGVQHSKKSRSQSTETDGAVKRPKIGAFSQVALIILARIGGAASGLLFTAFLGRTIGADGLGEISFMISLAMVLALFCTLNIEAGGVRFMVRYIANQHFGDAARYLRFSRRFVLSLSLGFVLCLAALNATFAWVTVGDLVFFSVLAAPFLAWQRLSGGLAMGFSSPLIAVIPGTFLRQFIFLLSLLSFFYLAGELNVLQVASLYLLALGLVLLVQETLLRPYIKSLMQATGEVNPESEAEDARVSTWLKIGMTVGLNVMYVEFAFYIAVICGAMVLDNTQVALLDVILKIVALLSFGILAVNQVFLPRISRAIAKSDLEALKNNLAISASAKLLVVVSGGFMLYMWGETLLMFFGAEFAPAYPILLLAILDPVCVAVFGPGANIVSLSKRPSVLLPILAVTLASLVGGVLVFGNLWGLWGAVLACVLSRFVWTCSLSAYCRMFLEIDTTILCIPRWILNAFKRTSIARAKNAKSTQTRMGIDQ